jgi:hypothetical protein
MSKIQVKGYSNLVKDPTSGGVVNNDSQAFLDYKRKRQAELLRINDKKVTDIRLSEIENDINKLKSDTDYIKNALNTIISKLT